MTDPFIIPGPRWWALAEAQPWPQRRWDRSLFAATGLRLWYGHRW